MPGLYVYTEHMSNAKESIYLHVGITLLHTHPYPHHPSLPHPPSRSPSPSSSRTLILILPHPVSPSPLCLSPSQALRERLDCDAVEFFLVGSNGHAI